MCKWSCMQLQKKEIWFISNFIVSPSPGVNAMQLIKCKMYRRISPPPPLPKNICMCLQRFLLQKNYIYKYAKVYIRMYIYICVHMYNKWE